MSAHIKATLHTEFPPTDKNEVSYVGYEPQTVVVQDGEIRREIEMLRSTHINVPIGCGDAPVFLGDVIVGDADGVVVIPAHLADEIAEEAFEMTAFEDFVAERVKEGRSILGLYPATEEATRTEFAAWRKVKGR